MSNTAIAVCLNSPFADWEPGFLTASAQDFFEAEVHYFGPPNTKSVLSEGGMKVAVDGGWTEASPSRFAAIVINGSGSWLQNDTGALEQHLRSFEQADRIVAGICAGTVVMARAGLLDERAHTSNGPGFLDKHAPGYRGKSHYVSENRAVIESGVITAPSSAPADFAAVTLAALFPQHQALAQTRDILAAVR